MNAFVRPCFLLLVFALCLGSAFAEEEKAPPPDWILEKTSGSVYLRTQGSDSLLGKRVTPQIQRALYAGDELILRSGASVTVFDGARLRTFETGEERLKRVPIVAVAEKGSVLAKVMQKAGEKEKRSLAGSLALRAGEDVVFLLPSKDNVFVKMPTQICMEVKNPADAPFTMAVYVEDRGDPLAAVSITARDKQHCWAVADEVDAVPLERERSLIVTDRTGAQVVSTTIRQALPEEIAALQKDWALLLTELADLDVEKDVVLGYLGKAHGLVPPAGGAAELEKINAE